MSYIKRIVDEIVDMHYNGYTAIEIAAATNQSVTDVCGVIFVCCENE